MDFKPKCIILPSLTFLPGPHYLQSSKHSAEFLKSQHLLEKLILITYEILHFVPVFSTQEQN